MSGIHPKHDEEREALLTAYALNQLSGAEQASVKASLAGDPAAEAYVAQTRRLAGIVEGALSSEAAPATSSTLRSEVEECVTLREVLAKPLPTTTVTKRSWRREIIIGTIAGGLLAALLVPGVREGISQRVAQRQKSAVSDSSAATQQNKWSIQAARPAQDTGMTFSEAPVPSRIHLLTDSSATTTAESSPNQNIDALHATQPDRYDAGISLESSPADRPVELFSYGNQTSAPTAQPAPGAHAPSLPALQKGLAPTAKTWHDHDGATRVSGELAETAVDGKALKQLAATKHLKETEFAKETRNYYSLHDGTSVTADAEQYEPIVENAFLAAKDYALSTFSIDVDTASYANTRRFLTGGQLPPPSAVRIEELINYFTYDDPQPEGNSPFSVNMELAQCPWTPGHHLLRVGLKGREIAHDKRPNSNLVFLLDVSGSMQTHNKLPLVKQAMQMLVEKLTENDMVTIVVYAGNEGLALDTTSGDQKEKILAAIENLSAGGSTHASAGITLAYEKAMQNFLKDGTNRVILCTDGDFNVGITDDNALVDLITEKAKSNVFLSVLGFGMGNLKDAKMEKLADKGNGNYGYIDTAKEAKKVLVEQMTGSLITIAKDVKIQIEFNPATIASYRQIGYENRVLAAKDFDDDTKDAGEIGAGHSVTALYEVVLVGNEQPAGEAKEAGVPLKYQRPATKPAEATPATNRELTEAAQTGELCTVKLRFKEPTGDKSELMEFPLKQEPKRFGAASENLRFASAVAAFGMVLRGSEHRGGASMSAVEEIASAAIGKDPNGYRAEFLELVRKAQQLGK